MNKKELKRLIKPIVKECVKESLLEEGLLSNIVMEVAKGLAPQPVLTESKVKISQKTTKNDFQENINAERNTQVRKKINSYRDQLMDSIGKDAYNGVNLFEGTTPLNNPGNIGDSVPRPGSVLGEDQSDSGVALTGPLSEASKMWSKLI